MNVDDLEGAIALRYANIQCPLREVLTGFKFEENEKSSKFRYLNVKKWLKLIYTNK
jgi:hypothetical protein